jgi:hypothetical protein
MSSGDGKPDLVVTDDCNDPSSRADDYLAGAALAQVQPCASLLGDSTSFGAGASVPGLVCLLAIRAPGDTRDAS